MAFIQEITKPASEENLCFVVFESWIEALVDRQTDFDEAFNTILKVDLTHSYARGHCQKAYEKFTQNWQQFQNNDTKVSILGFPFLLFKDFLEKGR